MENKHTPVIVWFLVILFIGAAVSAVVVGLVDLVAESHTAHIKEQCDKHGAEYLEIGNEKLCVKAVL